MEIHEILQQLDLHANEVRDCFAALTPEKRGWKPSQDQWSIDQHLEHLIVLNESYYPEFARIQRNERNPVLLARLPFVYNRFGNMLLSSVKPENKRKMRTMSVWEPSTSLAGKDMVDEFVQHHERLKSHIVGLEIFIGRNVIVSSPANKYIVYPLETALELIVTHEKRHIQHARHLLEIDLAT